jgi:hypothetical protein
MMKTFEFRIDFMNIFLYSTIYKKLSSPDFFLEFLYLLIDMGLRALIPG